VGDGGGQSAIIIPKVMIFVDIVRPTPAAVRPRQLGKRNRVSDVHDLTPLAPIWQEENTPTSS
jgi:hypothetical protein